MVFPLEDVPVAVSQVLTLDTRDFTPQVHSGADNFASCCFAVGEITKIIILIPSMQYLVHSVTVGLVNATMQQLGWSTRIRSPFWIEHSVLEDVTPWWPEAKRYRIWVKFLMCNSRKWKILHLWLVFLLPERRNNWKSDGNPHLGTVVIRGIKKMPWVHQGSQGGKYNVMFTDHLHHHRIHHASMKPSSPRAVPLPDCSPAKISCDPHHQ